MNKKQTLSIVMLTVCIMLSATFAYAADGGILDMITGKVVALGLTALLAIGIVAQVVGVISPILISIGTLFTTVGLAFADGKISSAELKDGRAKVQAVIKSIREAKKSGKKVK